MNNQRLKRAAAGWWKRLERARWMYGVLGRLNADGTVTVASDRTSYVWVMMDTGTLTQAYNKGNGAVPLRAGLPVRVREDGGRLIVDGEDTSGLLEGDTNAPGSVYSVNDIDPDSHGNVTLDTDDIDEGSTNQYYTAERAQDAIAAASIDTATIDFTYTDATPEFKWDVKNASITYAKIQNVSATDKVLGRSTAGAGSVEEIALTAFARTFIDDVDAAAMRTTLGLVIGTNVQAQDATLASIAALGTAADRMLYTTGVDTWAELTTTSYGRAFLALANAAALAPVLATSAHGATLDTTPLDADEVVGMDSSASFALIRTTWTSIKAFLKTYFDTLYDAIGAATAAVATHAALTATHGATGAIVGTANSQSLTNKTLDSTNIASLTGKTTPIDADSVVIVDSAASNFFKAVTGTNWKAYMKTYFDTLYGLLATANIWTQQNQFNPANTTGVGVGITRNLTATSTDSPVVSIVQDHATDDQVALRVQQDAPVNIAEFYDGAVVAWVFADGGLAGNVAVPLTQLDISTDATAADRGLMVEQHSTNAASAAAYFRKSRGTRASPSVLGSADFIMALAAQAYDGGAYITPGGIAFKVAGAVSSGVVPVDILFIAGSVDDTSFTNEVARFTNTGKLLVGVTSAGASRLGIQAGTSTNDAAVGGVLYATIASTGQVGAGQDVLATYQVPANTLAANGETLSFEASGTIRNGASSAVVYIYFGAANIALFSATGTGQNWFCAGRVIRTGAATQIILVQYCGSTTGTVIFQRTTATETLSGAVNIQIKGDSVSATNNDTVCDYFKVWWDDANT